jgi:two-component sensor histidine kinase
VPSLAAVVRRYAPGLTDADVDHLQRLVAQWQMLADLSFADLLLFLPAEEADDAGPDPTDDGARADDGEAAAPAAGVGPWACVAHVRPATTTTLYHDDQVGTRVRADARPALARAWREGRLIRDGDPTWRGGTPVREEAIPVRRGGRVVAVVARDTDLASTRSPSQLELAYLDAAADLSRMVAEGRFPYPGAPDLAVSPRVGDGLARIDDEGVCTYASPNALSAYRRLGYTANLVGLPLSEVHRGLPLTDRLADHSRIDQVLDRRQPVDAELVTSGAAVVLRAVPLLTAGRILGALVLVRDVTELRHRDRALLTKDATIREIHHRVKNNLQTVAALLRLQARRVDVPAAREALQESVRRVTSIALVHETLSQTLDEEVEFDGICDRLIASIFDVGVAGPRPLTVRVGSFGVLPAAVATPVALVLSELLQNAVEHAYGGGPAGEYEEVGAASGEPVQRGLLEVRVRSLPGDGLEFVVADDGPGLPASFLLERSPRLGLQIVRSLVVSELRGTFALRTGAQGGTEAVVTIPEWPDL